MSHVEAVAAKIRQAKCPEDLFGDKADGAADAYRSLAKAVHPDHFALHPKVHALAAAALLRLNELWGQAGRKIADGSYGDRKPAKPPTKTVIRLAGDQLELGALLRTGDIADVYGGVTLKAGQQVVVKVARSPKDNDLMRNEREALAKLAKLPDKAARYFPALHRSALDVGGRTGNILARYADHVPLDLIAKRAHLDFRDMAWMLRRTLEALYHLHAQQLVHANIIPPNLLFHPTEHGLRLIDWCYSVPTGKPGRAKSAGWIYPPELVRKQPLTPATDIYMACWCARWMLGPEAQRTTPRPIWRFLDGCLIDNPGQRPNDAGALHEEFGELLRRLVGPPKYHALNLSPGDSFT